MNKIIGDINFKVNGFFHLDFTIYNYGKNDLTIVGSQDILYYHDFEIIFKDVFTIICNRSWKIDMSKPFISLLENEHRGLDLNLKYQVEVDNKIFEINSGSEIPFYIIS